MEKVQLNLERFLPELRDLERKNLFSKQEIADIVSKRREHEVSCAKRDVKPTDYLRYIEYETALEKLRKLRAARTQATTRKTLSDHSIASHVTQLHRLAVRRFPSSHLLWDTFLSHALSQSSPALVSRTLSAAIAMHPNHVQYWIMASRWESDGDRKGMGGGNEEAARRLCMRALRFLKGSAGEAEVWKEWIRVEVVFAERMRARWEILGIGKGEEMGIAKGKKVATGEEEEEDEEIEVPDAPETQASAELAQATKKVETASAVSGQEALREGAIVRLVIDSCLSSYSHSITSYELILDLLRPLPSVLRLPLLSHVYTSLESHHPSTSSTYIQSSKILATRYLYDVAYDASNPKTVEPSNVVKVDGEALVDAIGAITDEFWKACKGSVKGKGKQKEKAKVEVWIAFCEWLDEQEQAVDDENLRLFLSTNLSSALSLAPPSPILSLLHLKLLIRTSSPSSTILTFVESLTKQFGSTSSPPDVREQVWAARSETTLYLPSSSEEDVGRVLTLATSAVPFSGKIWSFFANWTERSQTVTDVSDWYIKSIQKSLLSDAVPPIGFVSKLVEVDLQSSFSPRDLLPRRYLSFLSSSPSLTPSHIVKNVEILLNSSPTLSLSFLSYVSKALSLQGVSKREALGFRIKLFERIVANVEAGSEEWIEFAKELMGSGEVVKANEVVRRARRTLKGGDLAAFESAWVAICDA